MIKLKSNVKGISSISQIKNLLGDCRLILFGETHRSFNDIKIQENIISLMKPKIYIYEMLENRKLGLSDFDSFLLKSDKEDFSLISKYYELKSVINLVKSIIFL